MAHGFLYVLSGELSSPLDVIFCLSAPPVAADLAAQPALLIFNSDRGSQISRDGPGHR